MNNIFYVALNMSLYSNLYDFKQCIVDKSMFLTKKSLQSLDSLPNEKLSKNDQETISMMILHDFQIKMYTYKTSILKEIEGWDYVMGSNRPLPSSEVINTINYAPPSIISKYQFKAIYNAVTKCSLPHA